MSTVISPGEANKLGTPLLARGGRAVGLLGCAMEVIVLLMVCLAPWAYGAVYPGFEFLLYAALGLLLALWGVRMVLEGQLTWEKCPVALCLAGLFLTGVWQTTPLSRPVLAWISPATARLYGKLLPPSPEQVPGLEQEGAPAGATLSLDPGATRKETFQLLAVFLLFAVVRNNIASAAALRRLCVVALANAALLSLFGLVQFFSSTPSMLYWCYPSQGRVFGPFICANHFPFYVNMCVGLGVGLLASLGRRPDPGLAASASDMAGSGAIPGKGGAPADQSLSPPSATGRGALGQRPSNLLHNPGALWVCAALALILSGVAVCLSRGGYLALLVGLAVWLLAWGLQSPRSFRLSAALLVVVTAAGLIGWFGFGRVEARLATLWGGKALEEGRLTTWTQVLPEAARFPVWGAGYGAFPYIERMSRTAAPAADVLWEHAHNDYLEILIEGGLTALVLALLAVGLVFWLGWRAVSRNRERPAGALALGALFAFTTFVVHSGGDFGGHVPAIAVLATVLCAQLCGLGDSRGPFAPSTEAHAPNDRVGAYRLRLGGAAPLFGCASALVLGFLLCAEGWNVHRAEQARQAAWAADGTDEESAGGEGRIAWLCRAAAISPQDARLHAEIGQVCMARFDETWDQAGRRDRAWVAVQTVLAWTPPGPAGTALATAPSWLAADGAESLEARAEQENQSRRYLTLGLRHYLRARDLCPLMGAAHLALAAYADALGGPDDAETYLRRAEAVEPANPDVWYQSGRLELWLDRPAQAWESWRRCLELSDGYLAPILDAAAGRLGRADMARMLFPARPDLLPAAAAHLYPSSQAAERRPFLEEALRLLEARPEPPAGPDLRLKAVLLNALGRPAEAAAAYEELVLQEPMRVEWRLEFARLLYDQGRLREARRELLTIVAQQPTQAAARELLTEVDRELARRG